MRGNATLLSLVVIAAMTTTSLQLWRLWSMHASVLHERDAWYQQWFASSAAFDGVVRLLQASFDQCAQLAKAQGRYVLMVPEGLQKAGVVSVVMQYTTADVFVIVIGVKNNSSVRFLVEKQAHAQLSQLLVHHVTFGAVV